MKKLLIVAIMVLSGSIYGDDTFSNVFGVVKQAYNQKYNPKYTCICNDPSRAGVIVADKQACANWCGGKNNIDTFYSGPS